MQTRFLCVQPLASASANGIITALRKALDDLGVPNWQQKLLCLGTDGARVNTGIRNGVVALMKQELPWLKGLWCVAHKLELAMLDTLKEEKHLTDVKELLQGTYKQVKYSPKAKRKLQEIAKALDNKLLMPSTILGTHAESAGHPAEDKLQEHTYAGNFILTYFVFFVL